MSNDSLSMVLDNELAAVPRAAERVEAFCSAREIPGRIARRFNLALDEALTNVISHAFPDGGRHAIEVLIELRDGFLTATVIDDGIRSTRSRSRHRTSTRRWRSGRSAGSASICCGR